jgi:hypothetical protein
VRNVKRIALWLLVVWLALPMSSLVAGCRVKPTPAAPLSPEEQKKYEEELKKRREQEAKAASNN